MLIASAGYGKTTLAEQWSSAAGRRSAWYRIREASADVAVLAVDLATVAATIVPGCDRRLRERLGASPRPSDEASMLAEMLAEDLDAWPADAWLVLDDYHVLEGSPEAEQFIETLVSSAPLQLLVASRKRPSWISTRRVLYGEVFELGQAALAMSGEEAEQVLEGWRREQASGLIALAEGWPAVIGLAGVLPLPTNPGSDVPDELYAFFAEEVFQALDEDVRMGLGLLSVAPSLDRELVVGLLGPERAERVLEQGLSTGIIDDHALGLEVHPLARQFLDTRTAVELSLERATMIARCRDVYRARHDWDALFELVRSHGLEAELEALLEEALDELMNAARLTTVETWVHRAETSGYTAPVFRLAHAELSLRRGSHLAAQTLAESVASELEARHPLRFRALMTAGEAAHVGAKEDYALSLFRTAEANAPGKAETREAQWGQLMCMTELELDEATEVLGGLAAGVPTHDAREILREAGRRLGLELKLGSLESLDEARERAQLLVHVKDAVVRTSFRCVFAVALNLAADYELAANIAHEMITDAEEHRLDFTLPYGFAAAASAHAGLHDFRGANHFIQRALTEGRRTSNFHAEDNALAMLFRLLAQQGLNEEACEIELKARRPRLRSLEGELFTSRALTLACAGRLDEAIQHVGRVEHLTTAIETRVLARAVRAIVSIRAGAPEARAHVEELVAEASRTGAVDLLATSYRASPELLTVLLSAVTTRAKTWSLLTRTRDSALAAAAGFRPVQTSDPRSALSKREREIYELVCQGLSNKQIAACLFISEATVKVHVQHIFDKFGTRSRTALAARAARDRSRYAAPATTEGSPDSGGPSSDS